MKMVGIKGQVPSELTPYELSSAGPFIEKRRLVEIPALDGQTYGSGITVGSAIGSSGYQVTFNVGSSGVEWLMGSESYFRFTLITRTVAAVGAAGDFVQAWLDRGGLHSLIERAEIKLRNGSEIESLNMYSKLYSIMSHLTHSPEHVDNVEQMLSCDSMADRPYFDKDAPYLDDAKNEVENEEKLQADARLFAPARYKVVSQAVVAAGPVDGIGAEVKVDCVFKLNSHFLNNLKPIPLPYLQQLQIVLYLNKPNLAFQITKTLDNGTALQNILAGDRVEYVIQNPRYCAMMIEPSAAIQESFNKMYQNEGIVIPWISWMNNYKSASGPNVNLELNAGVRSARTLLLALQENSAVADLGNSSKGYPCQSCFRKFNLQKWSVESGSLRFPYFAPVNCVNNFCPDTFALAQQAVNTFGSTMHDTRIKYHEWRNDVSRKFSGPNAASEAKSYDFSDSRFFVIGVQLDRLRDYTGLDTTGQYLSANLEFATGGGYSDAKNLLYFLAHDRALHISAANGVTVRK